MAAPQPTPHTPALTDDHQAVAAALQAILEHLHQQARTDATLRAHLATLGQALSAIATTTAPVSDPVPTVVPTDDVAPAALPIAASTAMLPVTPLPPRQRPAAPESPPATRAELERLLRAFQGDMDTEPEEQPPRIAQTSDDLPDEATFLGELCSSCTTNAARIRQRLTPLDAPSTVAADIYHDWLEPLFTNVSIPAPNWLQLAAAYEAVATVAEILADVLDDATLAAYQTTGFAFMAEAQSALRAAAQQLRPRPDPIQEALFQWLRRRTQADGHFIRRYMRSDDIADPADWHARVERIEAWRDNVEDIIYRRRHERTLVRTLRSQIQQVERGTADEWPRTVQTIKALLKHGTPPSSRLLRDLLLPHHAALLVERERSGSIAGMLRAWKRLPAQPRVHQRPGRSAAREEPQISQVADLLRNTTVVLIGGDERPRTAQIIVEAFDLHDLVWCDTRPHMSHLLLESAIARDNVSVVLLAIRWASHGLGEIRTFCERYQKPLVRLPGGYSVSQLAYQIVQQASDRLTATRAEAARSGDG